MSFNISAFRPAAVTGGLAPSIHCYQTLNAPTVVDTAGYFNAVAGNLRVGDLIWRVQVNAAGDLVSAGFHVVRTITAAGVVDVTDTTVVVITNTR